MWREVTQAQRAHQTARRVLHACQENTRQCQVCARRQQVALACCVDLLPVRVRSISGLCHFYSRAWNHAGRLPQVACTEFLRCFQTIVTLSGASPQQCAIFLREWNGSVLFAFIIMIMTVSIISSRLRNQWDTESSLHGTDNGSTG